MIAAPPSTAKRDCIGRIVACVCSQKKPSEREDGSPVRLQLGDRQADATQPIERGLNKFFKRVEQEAQLNDVRNVVEKRLKEFLILDTEADQCKSKQRRDADDDPGDPEQRPKS